MSSSRPALFQLPSHFPRNATVYREVLKIAIIQLLDRLPEDQLRRGIDSMLDYVEARHQGDDSAISTVIMAWCGAVRRICSIPDDIDGDLD